MGARDPGEMRGGGGLKTCEAVEVRGRELRWKKTDGSRKTYSKLGRDPRRRDGGVGIGVVPGMTRSRISKLNQGWRGARHPRVTWRIWEEFDFRNEFWIF